MNNLFNSYMQDIVSSADVEVKLEDLQNGIVNTGNRYRLAKVFQKAKRGEEITVAFFGGSITAGAASATYPDEEYNKNAKFDRFNNSYCDHVCKWLEKLLSCSVKLINAGIGATDTPYAVHRMGEDVLAHSPDLVIVEWCVNDGKESLYKQGTYENMVRRFLESGVALIMLSLSTSTGASSQILHEPIAKHYSVPHISYKNAFVNKDFFRVLSNDSVHPNLIGHPILGLLVNYYLYKAFSDIDKAEKEDAPIPAATVHPDGNIYSGAYIASLKDIYEGKLEGVRITSLGSFKQDSEERSFRSRHYFGFTSEYAESYEPMVIELKSVKTAFLQIFRSNTNKGSEFSVKLNGEPIESVTFTCMHGTDNAQTEWCYHWATERLCHFPEREDITLEITPKISQENKSSRVRLYALLLS